MSRARLPLLGLVLVLAADAATAAPSPVALPIQTFRLPNGLTLLVVEDRRVPLVSVVTRYRFGTAQDPPGRPGLCHLVEHVMVERWGRRGAPRRYPSRLKGETTVDGTYYQIEVRRGDVALALWDEALRLTDLDNPADVDEVLTVARESARNEEEERDDRMQREVWQAAMRALVPDGHPYQQHYDPPVPTFQTTTAAEIQAFHHRFYWPSNAVIAVVGDVDGSEVQSLAQRYLGGLPPGMPVDPAPPSARAAVPRGERRLTVAARGGASNVQIIYAVPGASDPERPALTLLARVLGPAIRSRLVLRRGLADSLTSVLGERRLASWLVFELRPRPGHTLDELVKAFDEELDILRAIDVDPDDVAHARAILEFERTENVQGFNQRALALLTAEGLRGAARAVWTDPARIDRTTVKELGSLIQRHLVAAQRFVLKQEQEPPTRAAPAVTPPRPGAPAAGPVAPRRLALGPRPTSSNDFLSELDLADPALVRFTLSNGLPVVLASLHDVPRIDGRLIVNAGDAAAPPAQMGLAVAAAELSIRGYQSNPTAPRPGPAELGGRIWARTDWSTAAIGFASLPRSLEATLVRWTGALRRPLFKERELDLWKRRQLVHRSGVARDAGQTAKEVLVSRLFAASSSRAWPREGTAATVRALTIEDLRRFHRERYQPANATLVVTGDIERSALEELLEKYLGDWAVRAPARPPEPPPAEPPAGPRIVVVDMPGLKHAAVQIGTLVPSADSIERAASDVLAGQLAVQIGQATRTAGLVYRPSVSYDGQMGALRLSASVELRRAGELVRLVSAELEKLRRGPQWVEGVMETKLQDLFRRWESLEGIEEALSDAVTFDDVNAALSNPAGAYNHVEAPTIQRLAVRALPLERLILVAVGDRKVLEPQLAAFGKVTVLPPIP